MATSNTIVTPNATSNSAILDNKARDTRVEWQPTRAVRLYHSLKVTQKGHVVSKERTTQSQRALTLLVWVLEVAVILQPAIAQPETLASPPHLFLVLCALCVGEQGQWQGQRAIRSSSTPRFCLVAMLGASLPTRLELPVGPGTGFNTPPDASPDKPTGPWHYLGPIPRHPGSSPEAARLVAAGQPVILTGTRLVATAAGKWTLDYLEKHISDR